MSHNSRRVLGEKKCNCNCGNRLTRHKYIKNVEIIKKQVKQIKLFL